MKFCKPFSKSILLLFAPIEIIATFVEYNDKNMSIEPYTPIDESLCTDISDLVKSLARIYDDAVVRYTPIVNDICNRKASEDEVDNLLTWMLDFVLDERMLNLFKKVCRAYIYIYPEVVGFYVMHYHKEFVKSENEDLSEDNETINSLLMSSR